MVNVIEVSPGFTAYALPSSEGAVTAAALLTAGASAYDLNKDMGIMWGANTTVPSSEFAELGEKPYVTVTFTTDDSLADMEGHSYWVIKPMVNDSGWPPQLPQRKSQCSLHQCQGFPWRECCQQARKEQREHRTP